MLDSQTHTRSQRRSPKTPRIKGKTQDGRWAGLTDPSRVDGRNESGYNDYIGDNNREKEGRRIARAQDASRHVSAAGPEWPDPSGHRQGAAGG